MATRDYEVAAAFDGEVLELPLGMEFRANNHPIEFHVDDFEAAHAQLRERGVEFKAIHHRYAGGGG